MTSDGDAVVGRPAEELAALSLVMAAVVGTEVVADQRFAPGATVTVGSNSRNGLVIPEKFELTAYTLVTGGSVIHLAPPLFLQATVWLGGKAVELKGHVRDLRKKYPELGESVPLASERFRIHYATGIAIVGRFVADH